MDAICSVSPAAVVLSPTTPLRLRTPPHRLLCPFIDRISIRSFSSRSRSDRGFRCRGGDVEGKAFGEEEEEEEEERVDDVVERALNLDGTIPGSSDEFVKQVSSRAYDMRRNLIQTLDSSSYDVLEVNPWRETSKPVYVLTHKQNQLCTMRTRQNRSEVQKELGMLFSEEGRKWGSNFGNQTKQSRTSTKFDMFVEDVREGILVFEDENEALNYCNLLQGGGGGQGCEGVAEMEASSVFDLCKSTRALAVLFRRGRTPPQPERLELNLRARNHSFED